MQYGSVLACAAILLDIIVVAAVLRLMPGLRRAVLGGAEGRMHTLDGLRGIVALCVVGHHAIMSCDYETTGAVPALGNIANELGSCSVAIFFMISAYLFFGKIIAADGRLRLWQFIEGRVMRIVPLYLACITALVATAFIDRGLRATVPVGTLAREVLRWLAFDFVPRFAINGDPTTLGTLGQVWTLRYEWMLYAALPFLALAMRRARAAWPVFIGLVLGMFAYPLFAFFVAGATCAVLTRWDGPVTRPVWQVAGAAGVVAVVAFQHDSNGWKQALLLVPFMVAVLQGHRGWALLGIRPLRYLGEISYSIYLTHGFVLWVAAKASVWRQPDVAHRLSAMLGIIVGVVALSTITYLLIEKPTMRLRTPPMRFRMRGAWPGSPRTS